MWYACEEPERPLNTNVMFHIGGAGTEWHYEGRCGCAIAVEAAHRRSGTVADDILKNLLAGVA